MATPSPAASVTLADVQAAAARIRGQVYRSPLHRSASLSRLCGCDVWCKLDHLQITGSFKERGAINKLLSLTDSQKKAGVICASAGNHALAVAFHASRLGIPATVCMPRFAPLIKVSNCRSYGATVEFCGESFVEAYDAALKKSAESGKTFVPGFDDPAVVAGAGTAGLEVLEDLPDLDAVIVPVGGGGLLAGVGVVLRALSPRVRIIGVEPTHCPSLLRSLEAGQVVRVPSSPTLADGLAVAQVGEIPFQLIRGNRFRTAVLDHRSNLGAALVDRIELVDEPAIALAILRMMEMEKSVVEGAGAAPLAALMHGGCERLDLAGKKVVLMVCGGNIDVTTINRVIDRGLAADGRLCRVTCRTSDRPGSLARMTATFARTGASVVEVFHDRHFGPSDPALVSISAVLETRDAGHVREVVEALKAEGIDVTLG